MQTSQERIQSPQVAIRLLNSNLKGNMPDNEQNDNTWTAIVYQSMSGDSHEGNGTFEMVGGTLTSGNGGIFNSQGCPI